MSVTPVLHYNSVDNIVQVSGFAGESDQDEK